MTIKTLVRGATINFQHSTGKLLFTSVNTTHCNYD